MFKISVLIILISLFTGFAQARTCGSVFSQNSNSTTKSSTISNLHTKLERVEKSKGNVLLIHGLGDTLTHLNQLANQFKGAGYSVLRIDLHGHGKTLENFAKTGEHLPSILPFENNVKDLVEVVKALDFKNPIIVGHSYGGAIAHALANQLQGHRSFRPTRLIMMAPYLRRLDYPYLTGNPIFDIPTEYNTEQFMRNSYREYFESQKRENIDLLVDAAVATTKGIRSFDLLSSGKKASLDFQIPLLVLAGKRDELVKDDQIEAFHRKLEKEGYNHQIIFLEGDHFFPRENPSETFKAIMAKLDRP